MSKLTMKQARVLSLAEVIKADGWRVFLAESGNYGFFTNNEGTRVVSFGEDLELKFSGNYVTSDPKQTGTGWRIDPPPSGDFSGLFMFNAVPFRGCVRHSTVWRYTTLPEYLGMYQASSKFQEI